MTMTIDLPKDLESALSINAIQHGVSLQEYLLQLLYESLGPGARSNNGVELVTQRLPRNEHPAERLESESNQSAMARLRKIKISASPDFSMKVDLYEPEGRDAE